MDRADLVLSSLVSMVGEDFVSNRAEELYMYSRDAGASQPRRVDYVVMPRTVEEVQQIAKLANEKRIPITPMGGGLTLNALTVPVHGGIVMDMKRLDTIIEVNETSRYAVIEAGVSQGALLSYLRKNHPNLHHYSFGTRSSAADSTSPEDSTEKSRITTPVSWEDTIMSMNWEGRSCA